MRYSYGTKGVCSREVSFDMEDGVVTNVAFVGGCNGNLKAISKLVDGMTADEIVGKLLGNTCGMKGTSCADQFAKALLAAKKQSVETL
ncbi:MAG: TIGR03905 family TSCPD domain-containing protein [Clostridia bacterium]|nr:TIGR03905 family TSCPD domain-containing protein [Clostridia bacterium]